MILVGQMLEVSLSLRPAYDNNTAAETVAPETGL